MAKYIEREDLIRRLELSIKSWSRDCNNNSPVMVRAYEDILYKVKHLPTANVVEVVRCKDCKHFYESYYSNGKVFRRECRLRSTGCGYGDVLLKTDNGYCSFGERKNEA